MSTVLDQYIARFQNLPRFNIYAITQDGMDAVPWYEVNSEEICRELVLDELNIPHQVQTITAQIQWWGRLSALCKRVWELEERKYRSWRSQFWLDAMDDTDRERKTTKDTIEAEYRSCPEYAEYQARIERAEEAYNATYGFLNAYREKSKLLQKFAYRHREDGAARLSV